mmetsp:Transcript_6401/g.12220  ORF Transcript_6401/g.12220 Transcript_6401/m.12220 type:complete len:85 (+) Transcript_6401:34-288(+)
MKCTALFAAFAVVLPGTLAETDQSLRFLSGDDEINYIGHQNHILPAAFDAGIFYGVTEADCTYGVEVRASYSSKVYIVYLATID